MFAFIVQKKICQDLVELVCTADSMKRHGKRRKERKKDDKRCSFGRTILIC